MPDANPIIIFLLLSYLRIAVTREQNIISIQTMKKIKYSNKINNLFLRYGLPDDNYYFFPVVAIKNADTHHGEAGLSCTVSDYPTSKTSKW